MRPEQLHQIPELILDSADQTWKARDEAHDLPLHQRNEQKQDKTDAEQEAEEDNQARETSADPPHLESIDQRTEEVGDRERCCERHQNPLQQRKGEDQDDEDADPE
jgi:hypothetical protein